jgi:hypothetical protein
MALRKVEIRDADQVIGKTVRASQSVKRQTVYGQKGEWGMVKRTRGEEGEKEQGDRLQFVVRSERQK